MKDKFQGDNMEIERCENCDNYNDGFCEIWNGETEPEFASCVFFESQDINEK